MRAPSDSFKQSLSQYQPRLTIDRPVLARWASHPDADAVWAAIKTSAPELGAQQFIEKILTATRLSRARDRAYTEYLRDRPRIKKWCKGEVSKLLSSRLMYSEIADGLKEIASHLHQLESFRYSPLWVFEHGYLSRQDRRDSRVSRVRKEFIQNIHRYLCRHARKPLHSAVAMLTEITFPGPALDRDDVINALRPTTKAGRSKKKVAPRKRKPDRH
jgi:hypothetical protein